MKGIARLSIGLLIAGACTTASAVWEMKFEDMLALIDATVAVCKDVDPASVKRGQLLMEKVLTDEQRQDMPRIRETDSYQKNFKQEFDRLMSLGHEQKRAACQRAW